MVGLRPAAQRGLLQLHEVADLRALADVGLRPEVRERSEPRARCNVRTGDQAEVVDRDPSPICESAMRTWAWISQADPMRVCPSRITPGWMTVSAPISRPDRCRSWPGR